MCRRGFDQSDVAIESGTFVRPRFAKADVAAEDENILLAGLGEIGDVDTEGRIGTFVRSDDEAVEDDEAVARDAVEFERQAFARILRSDRDRAAIPAYARCGPHPAERFETLECTDMVGLRTGCAEPLEGEIDRPIMRQIDRLPAAVVELGLGNRCPDIAGFPIGVVAGTETEILRWIRRMPEREAPAAGEWHDRTRIIDGSRPPCRAKRWRKHKSARRAGGLEEIAARRAGHGESFNSVGNVPSWEVPRTWTFRRRRSPRRRSSARADHRHRDRYCHCRSSPESPARWRAGPCRADCSRPRGASAPW